MQGAGQGSRAQNSGGRAGEIKLSSECKGKPQEGIFDLFICMLTYYRKFQTFIKLKKNTITNPHILITLLQQL